MLRDIGAVMAGVIVGMAIIMANLLFCPMPEGMSIQDAGGLQRAARYPARLRLHPADGTGNRRNWRLLRQPTVATDPPTSNGHGLDP